MIWGSIWGLTGAVLSVPLLSVQKILLTHCNHPMARPRPRSRSSPQPRAPRRHNNDDAPAAAGPLLQCTVVQYAEARGRGVLAVDDTPRLLPAVLQAKGVLMMIREDPTADESAAAGGWDSDEE